jgi:DNA replication protein DnaC
MVGKGTCVPASLEEGVELLFTHLSLRAGQISTIVTTNLSFERWEEIFQDPVMTASMIDWLTHQAYLVNMNGNSYRMKQTKEWLEQQQLVYEQNNKKEIHR